VSDPSNSASATVPDTSKPTAPANLVATRNGASQVDLTWQSASDNMGVTGYRIFRGSTQVGTVGGTTLAYSDSPVGAGNHQYTVRAVDAAGNVSDPSNASSVTVPDSQKPTPPVNLAATTISATRVDLTWQAATDNVGVTGYQVFRGTSQIGSVSGTTFAYTDNSPGAGSQSYTVRAVDAAGNVSDPSNTATATVPDAQKPTAPSNLLATRNGASQVDLTWQASSDNVGVTGYRIFRGATQIATVGGTTLSYSDTGLATGTYSYTVRAVDAAGNESDPSNVSSVTVPDSQKPTPPGNLSATAVSPSQIDLSWQSSSDNVGVTGYRVFRGATQIASLGASATSHSDTGLAAGTYSYTVNAVDAAGNVSDPSNAASATTQAPPQTLTLSPEADARVQASAATTNYGTSYLRVDGATNPAVESLLRFTVNGVTAGTVRSAKLRLHVYSGTVDGPAVFTTNASWSESAVNWNTRPARTSTSIDDKGAIADNSWVEYDVTQFVTGNGTYSFGLATTSSDGANMYSRENATLRPELVVSTGTPDTSKPTTPGNLSATAAGPNRIDLSWMASTDNVGVTGYNVYRGGTLLAGIAPATAYADTTVAANTTYGYQVRAFDAAANISDPSNTATATTPAAPPAPTTLTIQPDADTRAQESQPTTNYGTSFLRTDGGTDLDVESYLRFTVNNVAAGSVLNAKLRVHAYSGSADGPALFTTGSSWSESTLNWNSRPAPTSAALQDKATIAANSWVEYDVTSIITGNGTYSFRLATTSTDGVDIYSRENATLRPELVVTLR
jgi:fibronectin type 3 domain-containing protein